MSSNSLARVPGAQAISVPDTWMVVAISLVAAALTDVLHEAVGHGGACLLIGAHPLLVSTVHFECSVDSRILSAGGTLVNLVAGLACLIVGRRVRAPHWRYFLWLLMTFNLLDAAGYFLYSAIGNIGDWAYVIHGYQPTWAWRVGLTLLGAATYWWFVLIALRELQPLLSIDQEQRLRLARRLLFTSYFTNGVLLTLAGLFNPIGMFLVAISAMAASFGGCSGLLWMGSLLRGSNIPPPSQDGRPITRSSAWIVTAAIIAIMFIAILGRGVRLSG